MIDPPPASSDAPGASSDAPSAASESPFSPPAPERRAAGPTALQIARLSRSRGLIQGRADLYRHIARLTDLGPEDEFVIVPSATGSAVRFLADLSGAAGAGVDADPDLVAHAVERARAAGQELRVHFDTGDPTDLPYADAVFDIAIGEIGLSATDTPAALRELVRVVRPGGTILLVQPVWTADVEERRRERLARRLGFRPFLAQRWKLMLREAGAVDLVAEDLSDVASSRSSGPSARTLTDFFTVRDRFSVAFAALRRWGWPGVSAAMGREQELRHLVTEERVLGLSLIRGTRGAPGAPSEGNAAAAAD